MSRPEEARSHWEEGRKGTAEGVEESLRAKNEFLG